MKNPINKQSFYAVTLLFIVLCSNQASGQKIIFYDVDISAFPTVKAKFFAFDEKMDLLKPSISDLTLSENGDLRKITSLNCPPPSQAPDISSVLVIDVSGSMSGKGLQTAKAAATVWTNELPAGSECAIVAFSSSNLLVQDFTNNKALLVQKIQTLRSEGGTDFNAALINGPTGGLIVSEKSKNKPVIIMLTDGQAYKPKIDLIVETANQQNCEIYVVTLGIDCPQDLKEISQRTGGAWFENISTQADAENIYRMVLGVVQGDKPCEIEWESGVPCIAGQTHIELKIINSGAKATASYQTPSATVARLEFTPKTVKFLSPEIGVQVEENVTVTAINANYTVTNISSSNAAFTITPTNFILNEGESMELTVRFTPTDSSYNFCKFEFESEPCPSAYYAIGGYKGIKSKEQTLKLTHPNGGEVFVVGSDTVITWEGILPTDTVHLEYSTDNGQSWQTITKNANGLSYKWANIPRPTSNQCLVRISQGDGSENPDTNNTAPQIEWQKTYGGSNFDMASSIQVTNDGGYIVAGSTISNNGDVSNNKGWYDFWILKLHLDGSIDWQKNYGGSNTEVAYSIHETSDRGYIVAGMASSKDGDLIDNKGLSDVWVLKLSIDGSVEWQKTYGGGDLDVAYSIQETRDGGYIIAGQTSSYNGDVTKNNGDSDFWILKLSFEGSLEWQKTYGGFYYEQAMSIKETINGGFIVAGYTESNNGDVTDNNGKYDVWVLKLSNDGSIEWQKTYGGSSTESAYSIQETSDGCYIIAGSTYSNNGDIIENKGRNDFWILKLKLDGSIEWQKTYGGRFNDEARSIQETNDGGYIIAGTTESADGDITENKGRSDVWVLKLSIDGVIEWQKTIGGSGVDYANSIKETSDGGYIIAGRTESNDGDVTENKGSNDVWVIKLSVPTILQSDVSDAVFSIVEPIASSRDIDMLQVLVGSLKDSVVSEFVSNVGTSKFSVDSIYIQGADASAFSLVAGFPEYSIEPSQSNHAEFRFVPNRIGIHTAEIVIVTQAETILQSIIGEGVESKLEIVNSLIDFGTIYVGDFVDSMQAVTVKNIGTAPFEILDTKHNYPNDVDFSTLSGGGNFILQTGQEALMDLRFAANSPGRTSGTLEFHYDGVGSPAVVQLFGEGIIDSDSSAITLEVLDAEGYASDAVKVYIVVTDSYLMQYSRAESFSLELNFNPSLLYPLDFTMDYIDERNAKIKIEDLPVDVETGDTLATIWFRAGLGNAEISELELTNIEAIGGKTTITHEDGTFQLLGICYEGGTRLFNANSKASIESVNPNPAENMLEVELLLNEAGQTELLIYNMQGEKVKELFKQSIDSLGVQKLKSDISDLSSGQYYLVLITPTYINTKNLVIMR